MSTLRWRPLLRVVQVVVTIGLMLVLIRQVEWSTLPPLFVNMRWGLVTIGIGLLVGSHLVNVARWQYLLHEREATFGTLLVYYAAGLFSNNFLPTGIGGDGLRAVLLSRSVPLHRAIFSVAFDRVVGLIALSGLLLIGLLGGLPPGLDFETFERAAGRTFNGALAPVLLGVALSLSALLIVVSRVVMVRGLHVRLMARLAEKWSVPQWSLRSWLNRFMGGYALSGLSHLCLVAAAWFILYALRIDIPFTAAVWLVLIGSLSLLFPVAVNGLGVFEGVYVVVLGRYGISASAALGAVLFMRIVMVVLSLTGGMALMWRRVPVIERRS